MFTLFQVTDELTCPNIMHEWTEAFVLMDEQMHCKLNTVFIVVTICLFFTQHHIINSLQSGDPKYLYRDSIT